MTKVERDIELGRWRHLFHLKHTLMASLWHLMLLMDKILTDLNEDEK